MNPFFSIVTINYNCGSYIEETIQSILNQSFENFEYIIIDGGSTDNSIEIIKKYDSRISYWISEEDKGAADALNKGFQKAKGEFVYYLNSDDILCADSLQKVFDFISKKPGFDVYYGAGYILKNDFAYSVYSSFWSLEYAASGLSRVFQQSHFIKRTAFDRISGFNLENKTCWDFELLVSLALSGASFSRHNVKTAVFRIHNSSITGGSGNEINYNLDKKRIQKNILDSGVLLPSNFQLYSSLFFRDFKIIIKRNYSRILRLLKISSL